MTWTPPDNPDPREILDSAATDTRDGSHAQALAKFLWFHHNALRCDSALVGVRLSFALGYWMELASVYQPAKAAFIRTRDETEAAFRSDPSRFESFHDLASLNEHIGDGARTADLFVGIARDHPAVAKIIYRVAEPFLIVLGRYEACGPFLEPRMRIWLAAHTYEMMRSMEETEPASKHPPLARSFYKHEVATLIGLLALNNRAEEAANARAQALTVLDDQELRELLDAAMTGHLPPPRFS